jgi:hypothetical protein
MTRLKNYLEIVNAIKAKNPASSSTFVIRERKFPGLRGKSSKK